LGNLNYFGAEIRYKDGRIKKLKGNLYGVMPTTASKFFFSLLLFENRTVQI
jgi:hypothetical protein